MKLVFGKGRASREDIEREAERELESLIASGQAPPAIDWSVYGLSPDVDPAVASADLAARSASDDIDDIGDVPPGGRGAEAVAPTNGRAQAKPRRATANKPRTRATGAGAKKSRPAKKPTA